MIPFLQLLPFKRLLILLAAGIAGIWYSRWEFDPAYVTTELFQQVYLTDEGLYTKSALALLRTGSEDLPRDVNTTAHTTPVHTWMLYLAMKAAGKHWTVARWVSIFMSCVALVYFWSACRNRMPAALAWWGTAAVGTNFMLFHNARLATADSAGIGFSALSLWLWLRWRQAPAGLGAALAVAITAAWAKPTYGPLLAAICLTELLQVWRVWRAGHWPPAAVRLGVIAAAISAHALLLHHQYSLIATTVVHTHSTGRLFLSSYRAAMRQLIDSAFFAMPILPAATVMLAAAVIGFFLQTRERRRNLLSDPLVQLCALWVIVNTIVVGCLSLHAARYYFGTILAWTMLAFLILPWNGQRYSARLGMLLFTANLCVQIPFYYLWLDQRPQQTYIAISRDIAQRITAERPDGAQLLGHGLPNWIALFDSRISARDFGYRGLDAVDPLESRIDYWRPEYLLINDDDIWTNSIAAAELRAKTPCWTGMDMIAEYKLLYRYVFPNSPMTGPNLKLYRMRYNGRVGPPGAQSGGEAPIYLK